MERFLSYMGIILGGIIVLWITSALTSEHRFSGETDGEVTDIFFVMPNKSGNWNRKCEVTYSIDGQTYEIHIDCPSATEIGDTCRVSYRPKRPGNAYVEW